MRPPRARLRILNVLSWLALGVLLRIVAGDDSFEAEDESGDPYLALSGKFLFPVAGENAPLAAGVDTFPIGTANVFGGDLPDVFMLNSRVHAPFAPAGIFLFRYEHSKPEEEGGVPVFSRSREAIEPPVPVKELISAHVAQDVEGTIHGVFVVRGGEDFSHLLYSRLDASRRSFGPATQLVWPQPIPGRLTGAWLVPCAQPPAPGGKPASARCQQGGSADLLLEIVQGRSDYPSRAASTAGFGAAEEEEQDQQGCARGAGAGSQRCPGRWNPKWTIQGQWDAPAPTAALYQTVWQFPPAAAGGGGRPVVVEQPRLASQAQGGTPYTFASVAVLADTDTDGGSGAAPPLPRALTLVTGSLLGEMEVLRLIRGGAAGGRALVAPAGFAAEADGTVARHATIRPTPVAFGSIEAGPGDGCGGGSAAAGAPCHLLVGGEGPLFWRRRRAAPAEPGAELTTAIAAFDPPLLAEEAGAALYGGSLPVPTLGDLDGDGRADLLLGNSEGRLLWFSSREAAEAAAEAAAAAGGAPGPLPELSFRGMPRSLPLAGEPFLAQPLRPIQGPAETRYGHTQPQLVDWDGDGVLDLLLSDADGHITVSMGRRANETAGAEEEGWPAGALAQQQQQQQGGGGGGGGPLRGAWWALGGNDFAWAAEKERARFRPGGGDPAAVRFGPRRTLLLRGNPLWGPWRVRPAAARVGGETVIVTLDKRNRLHAFSGGRRGVHLRDEGVLRSAEGTGAALFAQIGSAEAAAGDWGRATLSLVDFDLDGVLDLVIGTGTTRGAPPPPASAEERGGAGAAAVGGGRALADHAEAEFTSAVDVFGARIPEAPARRGGAGAALGGAAAQRRAGQPGGVAPREEVLPRVSAAAVMFMRGKRAPAGAAPPAGQWASQVLFHGAEPLLHDGTQLDFGRHKCSPEPVPQGVVPGGPHLLVGEEGGRLVFLHRGRLSSWSYPDGFPAAAAAAAGTTAAATTS